MTPRSPRPPTATVIDSSSDGPASTAPNPRCSTHGDTAFITDTAGTAVEVDEHHRAHAVVELAIRDLKEGAGLNHCPSGVFQANAAWAVFATMAHNLMRWSIDLGTGTQSPRVAKTMRRRLFTVAGRITRSGRTRTLHLPTRWPWADQFTGILEQLRALPAPSG